MEITKMTISNFWNAIIASVVFVTTALLLEGNDHLGKIIIGEMVLFGVKSGADLFRNYNISRKYIK